MCVNTYTHTLRGMCVCVCARAHMLPPNYRDIFPSSANQGANLCQLLRTVILQLQHQGEASSQPWICIHQHLQGTQVWASETLQNLRERVKDRWKIHVELLVQQGMIDAQPLRDESWQKKVGKISNTATGPCRSLPIWEPNVHLVRVPS